MRGWGRLGPAAIAFAAAAGLMLASAGAAAAATVVNGDFESGNLSGWNVHRTMEVGDWFAYKGTVDPIAKARGKKFPPQAPPQGTYAAIADELSPETLILSQDISLAPGASHRLSLLAYYDSTVPIAVPSPDTLAVGEDALGGRANQQFRIDVMKPEAPLESLDPGDILRTVFRTQPGAAAHLPPTWFSADLTPFAGQTVRLRIAVAAHEELLTAGVDAVAVDSTKPGQAPPPLGSSRFSLGKPKLNRRNGTAALAVEVPGPGTVTAKGGGVLPAAAKGGDPKAHATKAAKQAALIVPVTARAAKAGTVTLQLKPTAAARAALKRKHKLRVLVEVSFDPAGGSPRTATKPVVLRLARPAPHRH